MYVRLHVLFPPGFFTQVHYFLGSSSTFDGHHRDSKDCFASSVSLAKLRHFLGKFQSVHRTYRALWVFQCFSGSLDQVISQLQATGDHKVIVSVSITLCCFDKVVGGLKISNCLSYPVKTWIQQTLSVSHNVSMSGFPYTSSDVGVSRLVVVHLLRVKNRNIRCLEFTSIYQLGGNRVSSWTSSDDCNS